MPNDFNQTNYNGTGSENLTSDDEKRIMASYDAVCDAEENVDNVEKELSRGIPKKFDVCDIDSYTDVLNKVITTLQNIENKVTKAVSDALSSMGGDVLSVDVNMTKYVAVQIILKKFQILKYRIENIKISVEIMIAKMTKMILKSLINGKGSAANPVLQAPMAAMNTTAGIINGIISALNAAITLIKAAPMSGVKESGMCFFPTAKSIQKVDMTVANPNQSITNFISEPINKLIAEAEQVVKKSLTEKKKKIIADKSQQGLASAITGFDAGESVSLPKFNPQAVKDAVNGILMNVLDAEALPRYEKLSVNHFRFFVWLSTGFVPAGKRVFGIPGYA